MTIYLTNDHKCVHTIFFLAKYNAHVSTLYSIQVKVMSSYINTRSVRCANRPSRNDTECVFYVEHAAYLSEPFYAP